MIKKKKKFCPKCGAGLNEKDKYCINCGYNFKKRKKIKISKILIYIIIIIILWTVIRLSLGKEIIPQPLVDILKNKTG